MDSWRKLPLNCLVCQPGCTSLTTGAVFSQVSFSMTTGQGRAVLGDMIYTEIVCISDEISFSYAVRDPEPDTDIYDTADYECFQCYLILDSRLRTIFEDRRH